MTADRDVAKHIVELVDGTGWELADYLAEQFPPEQWGDPSSKANNGLRAELDNYQYLIAREFGAEVKGSTMRDYRSTALAWPQADRSACASFMVHARLRGDDRHEQMAKYVRLAEREHSKLSRGMLTRYRADENRKTPRSYEQRLRSAIANGVRRQMLGGIATKRKDWWMAVTDAERDVAVRELRALAKSIAAGPIGGESDG